ncbi:MAG TPA: hypothetical protein DCS60_05180 [Opitutae bacterium]|nr:hypothetical protein [Opitutae bacterium]
MFDGSCDGVFADASLSLRRGPISNCWARELRRNSNGSGRDARINATKNRL